MHEARDEEETMNLYGPKQLADSMRTVRKNTILIAEDIPEKNEELRLSAHARKSIGGRNAGSYCLALAF